MCLKLKNLRSEIGSLQKQFVVRMKPKQNSAIFEIYLSGLMMDGSLQMMLEKISICLGLSSTIKLLYFNSSADKPDQAF